MRRVRNFFAPKHRDGLAGDHLFRSQVQKSERFENSKIGKRDGSVKVTTEEPSPNSNVGNNYTSENFPCKAFAAETPYTSDFWTCKAFPYSVLNTGYLLNQTSSEEKFPLSGPALVTLQPIAGLRGWNRVAEHLNGSSGAGLRPKAVEP